MTFVSTETRKGKLIMRNVAVALLTVLGMATSVSAQTQEWANKLFPVTAHDFGTVAGGAKLKHTFLMKNIYKVPLEIISIREGCTCVSYKVIKKTLQPNESGAIEILMDGTRFSGPKTVNVRVTVGPEFVSTATLTVSANARQDVVFNPGTIDFGIVSRGQMPTHTMDIEYAGALEWQILEVVKNATAPFDIKVEQFKRTVGRFGRGGYEVGYRMTLTLKADAPAGAFKQQLLLKTNDAQSPVLTVVAEGNVQASLSVAPSPVNLGTMKIGETQTRKVLVRGNQPFRILAIDGGGDGITIDLPTGQAARQDLTVRCQPMAAGEFRKQFVIRTDDNQTATVTVEVNVTP